MTGLAEWLLARIAEDEAAARACVGVNELAGYLGGKPIPRWVRDGWQIRSDDERRIVRVGHTWAREADHIARWDPARVLAECEAKRRLIALGEKDSYWDDVLRLLALPYADHPDYRDEWRP